MKTKLLRKELQRLLKTEVTNVYYEEAPKAATYPYLVYELSELISDYGKTLMQIEVNILDYGSNSSVVEDMADNVQKLLHRYYYLGDGIQFRTYKGLRQIVREEDKQIIRRRLIFELHLFELKEE